MNKYKKILLFTSIIILFKSQFIPAQDTDSNSNDDGTIIPEVKIQSEDYKLARLNFKTKLLYNKPAPQKSDSLEIPPGAAEIEYPSGELNLKAWINLPGTGKDIKHPVVIFLHGGFSFGKEDWEMSRQFRDSGFIVMAPILRGENGQDGYFSLFYDEVDDVIAAAEYIKGKSFTDKDRIFVAGHSTGGTLAMLSAMTSDIFRAGVSFSGSPDQIIFCKYGIPGSIIPFDTNNVHEFEMRSPLAYAKSFKCPVRIYYGTNEPHFHLSSVQTALTAKENALNVEAIQVQGDHFSAIPEEINLSIAFFKSNERR